MGREEECEVVETPRRRVKRDRAATTKYDPDMYDNTVSRVPMYHEEEIATSGTKRKRAKKARGEDDDDDWVPDRIAPPPPRNARIHDGRNDDVHLQQQQYQYNNVYAPPQTAPSMSTSVFHDTPVMIQSFTETVERRRNNANSSNSSSLKINTQEREFDHSIHITPRNGFPVRFPLSSTTSTQGQSARFFAQTTMTVMDLFYPDLSSSRAVRKDHKSIKQEESTTPANNGARESKRRRRGDTSTTRSSRSRSVQEDGNDPMVYDMLQFGVDSVKLIPQGLVDRIDPEMRGEFVTSIIINHVENWSRRAGFGGVVNNFVHELATLLTAYYPCTHPTLLDEVLSSFVFKRPELLAPLLRPMIDKIVKMGEAATPSKYPIIQSFARKCNPQGISTIDGGHARHNLACLTLLQCLVEQNIEGFSLTSWIVVCATSCTRKVREMFWENMIRSNSEKRTIDSSPKWQIYNPLDHISEILTIERILMNKRQDTFLNGASDCSLAVTLIWTLLCHTDLEMGAEITSEAFTTVFGYGSVRTCAKLLHEWLDMIRGVDGDDDSTAAWTTILNTIITNCSQLSVAETSWFVVRVLHCIINQPRVPTATLKMLLVHHASLLLGDADPQDMDELVTWQQAQSSSTVNFCGTERTTTFEVYKGEHTTLQLRILMDELQTEENGEKFLDIWSEAWGNGTSVVLVPWCYVWAIISFCVLKIKIVRETPIDKRFSKIAEQVCDQYFDWLLSGDQEPRKSTISIRITQMFELIRTRTHPFAQSLLVRMLHKCCSRFLATRTLFSNVVISNLASSRSRNVVANPGALNMIFRVATLTTLAELANRDDTIGDYTHSILLSRPLFHVINNVISSGDDEEVALVLDALTNAINRQDLKQYEIDSPVVELLVVCMYRRGQHIARKAGLLLEAIAYKSPSFAVTALWCLLQVSGNYCCGCKQEKGTRSSNIKEVVVMCADLFQSIWMSLESDSTTKLAVEILTYLQHRMVSCTSTGLGWNVFLVQVLLRLIQCGYGEKSPSIIRFVTSAFERESGSLEDESLQLEILHAFCTELRSVWPDKSTNWSVAVSLVCSAQVRHRLRKLATQSACTSSATLAKMILHSSMELKMLKRTQVDNLNVIEKQGLIKGC